MQKYKIIIIYQFKNHTKMRYGKLLPAYSPNYRKKVIFAFN